MQSIGNQDSRMVAINHLIKERKGLKLERLNIFTDIVTLLSETPEITAWDSVPRMGIVAYPARNASF